MKTEIEEALKIARTPEPINCSECGDKYYAPMDKLCIALYGKCPLHLEDDSFQEKNLLKLSEII